MLSLFQTAWFILVARLQAEKELLLTDLPEVNLDFHHPQLAVITG